MRELNKCEQMVVVGGDNPSMGPYDYSSNPGTCANAILFWSGTGSSLGGMVGAFFGGVGAVFGGFGGFAAGGGIAAKVLNICKLVR